MAAPSPSAASLPFNPALPFLGIESSPRLFTEPAFCGLLTGVVQAPGKAQGRTTCPAWGRVPVSLPPSNLNCSQQKLPSLARRKHSSRLLGSRVSAQPKLQGKPGTRSPSKAYAPFPSSQPLPVYRQLRRGAPGGRPRKSQYCACAPPSQGSIHQSGEKQSQSGGDLWSRDTLSPHPKEFTGGKPSAYGSSAGQYRLVSLAVLCSACWELLFENWLDCGGLGASNDSP